MTRKTAQQFSYRLRGYYDDKEDGWSGWFPLADDKSFLADFDYRFRDTPALEDGIYIGPNLEFVPLRKYDSSWWIVANARWTRSTSHTDHIVLNGKYVKAVTQ